ncbi:MAG: RagB/SusD family nutrient uptake outer membrane protein [Prevotella sp.]|nr:RagB/SusD family nutrient uptake outer membrane protein [Prevotella sp.]
MKKKVYILACLFGMMLTTSCNDWLDIKPNNEQVTDDYWQSKEDVESVVTSGYYYMRDCVPFYIKWGELRGGAFYSIYANDNKLQDFNLTPSYALCKWDDIYKVIGMANSVLAYAPGVRGLDDTYYESMMNSHLCEAYFQRAYSYLILLKNYREVPLITQPYVDDNASFDVAKSSEADIVAQIKKDVEAALATGAAKGVYETDWQTKGRATKWALYALMADVCLWNEEYDECIKYCDMILDAKDQFRPVFMTNTNDWYTMFYPGNSNESIFELNWDYNIELKNNNFATTMWSQSSSSRFRFTNDVMEKMRSEMDEVITSGASLDGRVGRMYLATFVAPGGAYQTAAEFYLWKYNGTDILDASTGRVHQDANFIIYRVAEVILMKAQAEIMKGNFREALVQINRIRNRAGLGNYSGIDLDAADADAQIAQLDELTLLEEVLDQKELEFIGEGKRWYDLLWFGRISGNKYKEQFITQVLLGNQTTNKSWIRSVLIDPNSWYMPIPQSDIDHNRLLEQNPYYSSTK